MFILPATFINEKKLIEPTVTGIENARKADKSLLFQIVLGNSQELKILVLSYTCKSIFSIIVCTPYEKCTKDAIESKLNPLLGGF